VSMAMKGLPKTSKSCGSCGPKCKKILDTLLPAYESYAAGDEGAELFRYATQNMHFTTTGFGATSHACFGHTYQGIAESSGASNKCYSFGARIGMFFKPSPQDIMVSNCGDKVTVMLYCNCTNSAGKPYPQRYTWIMQLQDAPWLDGGFQFYKLNAVLDSEITVQMSIQDKDLDPFMCNYIQTPLKEIAPMPEPSFYFPPTNVPNTTASTCEECPKCDSRYEQIESALKEAMAGNGQKFINMMSDDIKFDVVGGGPTKSACFGDVYEGKEELLEKNSSPLKRLQSMVASSKVLSLDLMIDSCGDKFNAFLIFELRGKSGFGYTLHVDMALYLEDEGNDGFKIKYVRTVDDTEVMMNMAQREMEFDSFKCDKLGDWSESLTHTTLQL